jgi:hypothetical protein
VSLIWLTAASTLFASLPHIECRCPDGHLKAICFASVISPESDCCSEPRDEEATECTGCCGQKTPRAHAADSTPDSAGQVKQRGCNKQLIQPGLAFASYIDVPTIKLAKTAPLDLHVSATTGANLVVLPQASCSRPDSQHAPPPPDLLILLQHFLI